MSELRFDRDAVGVSAKRDWHDAEVIGRIAGFASSVETAGTATAVGEHLDAGAVALEAMTARCVSVVQMIVAECSDAAAVLGSGQESAIADMDTTESTTTAMYDQIFARMEGK
ncbi:MAG: hypothetical protein Q4D96_07800 [Propionibacteriaceae bacterium]|nr:hypothetical protein [Propionibacteriaceae bacterium]